MKCMGIPTRVDLVNLEMLDVYIILVMYWLSLYHVIHKYNVKNVNLYISRMDKLGWEGVHIFFPS